MTQELNSWEIHQGKVGKSHFSTFTMSIQTSNIHFYEPITQRFGHQPVRSGQIPHNTMETESLLQPKEFEWLRSRGVEIEICTAE